MKSRHRLLRLALGTPREKQSQEARLPICCNIQSALPTTRRRDGSVHLRPHEIFPAVDAETLASNEKQSDPALHPLAAGLLVAPAPISAQPGEAVSAPPRSAAPAVPSAAQRTQLRESPTAGDPAPQTGQLDARTSTIFNGNHIARQLHSHVITGEQSNTSIIYGQQFILKLFRRLQPGENPEVEIGRYLTEAIKFPHIAPFMGEIAITPNNGEKTTTAVLQGLVENERDGWTWFLDQFNTFFAKIRASAGAAGTASTEARLPHLSFARTS